MDYFSDQPKLTEAEARDFYAALVLKYNSNDSPYLEGDSDPDSESLYGEDTVEWIVEFFWDMPDEIYVLEDSKTILKFASGRDVIYYIRERGWTGYEYFITNPTGDFLWKIWHEETIHGCGTAMEWVRSRKMRFFELLGVPEQAVVLSEIQVSARGRTIEVIEELPSEANQVRPFRMSFLNCDNIDWVQRGSDPPPEKLKVTQTYFEGQFHRGFGYLPIPFFALLTRHLSVNFTYTHVSVSMQN